MSNNNYATAPLAEIHFANTTTNEQSPNILVSPLVVEKEPPLTKETALANLNTIDVIGVNCDSHGRSCFLHSIGCGSAVKAGDKLVCRWAVQEIEPGCPEEVVKVYKLSYDDGLVGCHIGYLQKRLFVLNQPQWFDLMMLKVAKDLRGSESSHERARSHRWHGLLTCAVIKGNLNYNGRDPFNGESCDVSVAGIDAATSSNNDVKNEIEELKRWRKIQKKRKGKNSSINEERRAKLRKKFGWSSDESDEEEGKQRPTKNVKNNEAPFF